MPKQIRPERSTIHCFLQDCNHSMELPFNISADPDSVRRRIIPSLPSGVDPLDVAVFPRMASGSSPSVDVLVNPFAAQSLHDNQDLKSELAALRRELKSANDLHVVELAALREATEELRHTRLQLGSLNRERMHRNRLMKPKVMIGVLGWLAKRYCKIEKGVPVEKYATRLTAVLDARTYPENLQTDLKERPYLQKTLTHSAIAKMDAAAVVAERDEDAHLENAPIVLLASLMDLEQGTFDSGVFGPGEEGAELSALRLMLARLGKETAGEYLRTIKADPMKYGVIAEGQEERFAMYL